MTITLIILWEIITDTCISWASDFKNGSFKDFLLEFAEKHQVEETLKDLRENAEREEFNRYVDAELAEAKLKNSYQLG